MGTARYLLPSTAGGKATTTTRYKCGSVAYLPTKHSHNLPPALESLAPPQQNLARLLQCPGLRQIST